MFGFKQFSSSALSDVEYFAELKGEIIIHIGPKVAETSSENGIHRRIQPYEKHGNAP